MSSEEMVVSVGTWDADTLWHLVGTLQPGTVYVVTHQGREIIRLCLANLPAADPGSLLGASLNPNPDRPIPSWFGAMEGSITIAPNFDDPLPEIMAMGQDDEPDPPEPA